MTVSPAGVRGFMGGGDPLDDAAVETIESTDHVVSTVQSLSDQLGEEDTDITSALELGSFGQRQQRFDMQESTDSSESTATEMPQMSARMQVTGTTDLNSISTNGSEITLSSGESFNATSANNEAVIGSAIAEENGLSVGDSFTMYDHSITVVGIYETGNNYQDNGIVMPLATLQTLTSQPDAVTSVIAAVDSAENVASVVESLEVSLGDAADITSDVARAENSVSSLTSIAGLTLTGIIGAAVAGVAIIGLGMILVVRERRREIGVMKAIGGSNIKIVSQFVSEGLTITIVGALLGLFIGLAVSAPLTASLVSNESSAPTTEGRMGLARGGGTIPGAPQGFEAVNSTVTNISAQFSPEVFVIALLIVVAIAVAASAIPAWATTKVKPAEVLRSE